MLAAIVFIVSLGSYFSLMPINTSVVNTVDHKNLQLNLYLDFIKYNTQEKLGILPYILAKPEGIYLEVGTGGDPIAELLSKIPDTVSPTIIASDIDENILKLLPIRHPQLNKYLISKRTGPQLKLQALDAQSMSCFDNNYLSGINISAVIHEIVSYAGGMQALDNFFAEAFRVLKQDGVIIYRDPESVTNMHELVHAQLKSPSIRLFVHIFLIKFLDDTCGKLAKSGRKYKKYNADDIRFTFYKKNEISSSSMSYKEYLQVRSYEIDFSRHYSLTLPRGLCREIERHYLTYLHQCNPLMYVKCLPSIDSNSYFVNYLAHSTGMLFDEFLHKNGLSMIDGTIALAAKRILDQTVANNMQSIEYGILLHFSSKHVERQLYSLLKTYGFEPNIHLIQIKEGECLLDYRIFGLLYDHISEEIFNTHNGPINTEDTIHAQWLRREGEETYIYHSDDELISKVAHISFAHNTQHNEPLILCPISPTLTKFIPRLCYDEILKNAFDINDMLGYPIEIKEGKRIIHFSKMPLKNALPIFEEIIKSNPDNYTSLQKWLDGVKQSVQEIEALL